MLDPEGASEVFAAWYERLLRGEAESSDALCRAHPELAPLLRVHVDALAAVDEVLRPHAREPELPVAIGPYAIEAELGRGGMGVVYRARVDDAGAGLPAGTQVALKVLHPHVLARPGAFKRFLREAQIGRRVEHPNVVRILDADALAVGGSQHHFLVMEHVEGQTLRELQEDLELVPEELCRHIGREVSAALAAIHAAGAVHRDLKPENVLITPDHRVKVTDLGVARLADEAVRLSQTGLFVGSVHYAAPEQFAGGKGPVDGRADLHALGVVLYELATGSHPFLREDYREVMRAILERAPRKPGELNPQLSPFFEHLLLRLLAKAPEDRFASAAELTLALEQGQESAWWRGRAAQLRSASGRPLRRIRVPRETEVYGRERELAVLMERYQEVRQGSGRVVWIRGEAGIGKTRLVDEFLARLAALGEEPNFLFGSYPPGGAASGSGAFSTAYREYLGAEDLEAAVARVLPETPGLVPAFAALLRGDVLPNGAAAPTQEALQTCFVHATRNIAAERATVVLIDDLHHAPREGRALFLALSAALAVRPVLLVGTARPGVPEAWLAELLHQEHASVLTVPRLGPKDLVRLLEDSFRSRRLAEELGARIAVKSDGNPFFVFEIIRGLQEGQFITQRPDGSWETTRVIEEIQIPSSILDLVNARVAGLEEEERNLLDVAACCGFEFDPLLVGEVLGLERIPLLRRLGQIERRHRLVRSAGFHYAFDHHQVQEALYGSLSALLRREYHAALGEAIEARADALRSEPDTLEGALCVELCRHFLRGDRGRAAVRYLRAALSHLARSYLHADAVALADQALAEPGLLGGRERAEVLLDLCRMHGPLDSLAQRERQEQLAREAEMLGDAAGDPALRRRAAEALGWCLSATSRNEEAEQALRRALSLAEEHGSPEDRVAAMLLLAGLFAPTGRLQESRDLTERMLVVAREAGFRKGEAHAHGQLGMIALQEGRVQESCEHYERAIGLLRELGDLRGEAAALANLGGSLRGLGRLAEARSRYEEGVELHRKLGDRRGEAIALLNLGAFCGLLGERRRARSDLECALRICREIGARYPEGFALHGLASVQDDKREAVRLLEESLAVRRSIGDVDGMAVTAVDLANIHLAEGRHEEVAGLLGEVLEALRAAGGRQALVAMVLALGARLPGADPGEAEEAVRRLPDSSQYALTCNWNLWLATRDQRHLESAKRLADQALAAAPIECRASMAAEVSPYPEIRKAWLDAQAAGEA